MNGPLVLVGWTLTAAVAFFAGHCLSCESGGSTAPQADDRSEDPGPPPVEARILSPSLAAPPARALDDSNAQNAETAPTSSPAFSLEGVTTGTEISKRLMTFVDAQLRRGAAGNEAILGALDTVWSRRWLLKDLFEDDTSISRELYPWVKLLVDREPQMLDLTEFVFRTMAQTPETFAETPDPDVLQMFTERIGFLLPGAVGEERLARFRAYAVRTLDTPEAKQPDAVKGNRARIERLLARVWPVPLTPDQALAELRAGGVPDRDLTRLLRLVPPDALATLDVTALIAPLVRTGDPDVMGMMGSRALDHLDLVRLDDALLEATNAGKADGWMLATCFQRTGRKQWSDVRPFFDKALVQSDASAATALRALAVQLPQNLRPDRAYIEDLLSRRTVSEATQVQLRAAYGIK